MKLKQEKENSVKKLYESDLQDWETNEKEAEKKFIEKLDKWTEEKELFIKDVDEYNIVIDQRKSRYDNSELEGVIDYVEMVLDKSLYPEEFPKSTELEYDPENKSLIIDYQLPDKTNINTLKGVKYIQTRDEFSEKHISETQLKKLYDNTLYQISLRTLYEVFETDAINALELIVFNGYVNSIDPATGQEKTACILSLQASKQEFLEINLANVEPRACFKNLKGVSSSKLYSLTPIAPITLNDN